MASSIDAYPPFLRIESHQVHLKDYCYEVNVRHILANVINHIALFRFVPFWQSTNCRFVTLLPTVEAFSLKLQLLKDSLFRSQLSVLPFVVGFLELGTLTMFHKVSLGLVGIVCPFLLRSSIVFFDVKSNNQIFNAYFLSIMLEVILEVFPRRRQLLNNSCNLKSFA